MKHLEKHNILTDSQHGFRAKRSTETKLIQTIHDISKSLDKKEIVDMAMSGTTKAGTRDERLVDGFSRHLFACPKTTL